MTVLDSFASVWITGFTNPILISILIAFTIAQFGKLIYWTVFRKKRFNLGMIFKGYGGFPSAHTAVVTALTASIYVLEGFSNLYYVTLTMSVLWVVYVLDIKMFSDLNVGFTNNLIKFLERPDIKHMETIMGHTYGQVLGGLLVGLFANWIIFF